MIDRVHRRVIARTFLGAVVAGSCCAVVAPRLATAQAAPAGDPVARCTALAGDILDSVTDARAELLEAGPAPQREGARGASP